MADNEEYFKNELKWQDGLEKTVANCRAFKELCLYAAGITAHLWAPFSSMVFWYAGSISCNLKCVWICGKRLANSAVLSNWIATGQTMVFAQFNSVPGWWTICHVYLNGYFGGMVETKCIKGATKNPHHAQCPIGFWRVFIATSKNTSWILWQGCKVCCLWYFLLSSGGYYICRGVDYVCCLIRWWQAEFDLEGYSACSVIWSHVFGVDMKSVGFNFGP